MDKTEDRFDCELQEKLNTEQTERLEINPVIVINYDLHENFSNFSKRKGISCRLQSDVKLIMFFKIPVALRKGIIYYPPASIINIRIAI